MDLYRDVYREGDWTLDSSCATQNVPLFKGNFLFYLTTQANTIRINTYFFGTYYFHKSVDSFLSLCYVVRYVVIYYVLKYVTLM